jgi:hypothetical protein
MINKGTILLYLAISGSGVGLVKYAQNKTPPEIISEVITLEDKIWEMGSPISVTDSDELPQYIARLDSLSAIPGVEKEVKEYKLKYKRLGALGIALALGPAFYMMIRGRNAFQ